MRNVTNSHKFPLSLSQNNILNLERILMGTSVNNISTTIRISGRLDFPALQKSIQLVLESDVSLRTRLIEEDGVVLQYHVPYEQEEFPVYDFSNTSQNGLENWENAITRESIPLFEGPLYHFVLFRDGESSGGVLVKLHHIIADGWSQIMLCNKIARAYLDLLAGKTPDLEEAPDYELHVEEENEYLQSKAYLRDEQYWKEIVRSAGEPSVLKSVNSAAVSPVGRRISFTLPEVLNHAIYTYCEQKRVAPFSVFYMALAIYFKRNGGAEHFTIGVPIFNRTNYIFKQSMGMFVTTLPFYNEISDEWSFNTFNDTLTERWLELLRHQRYPFSAITELADGKKMFNIALSYQDSKIYESRDASVTFSGRWHYCGYQAEQLTIHLTNLTNHRQYAVDYDYLAQFFAESEIVDLHQNLCHILAEALSQPDRPIHELSILSLEQKEEILYTFNRTDRYVAERSVYNALIENNLRHPNRVALIQNGERVTYGALFHRGAQYAGQLYGMDLGKEPLIGIHLPKSFELLYAMVGCLQMGGAYVLLPESLPEERLKTILSQSKVDALITSRSMQAKLENVPCPVLYDEEINAYSYFQMPCNGNNDENPGDKLAYVVYTSGSTGEPKGVEITQRNVLNLAQEMEPIYGPDAVLSLCSIGFDAFMLESIVALLNGRTIVLTTDSDVDSPERLAALMNGYAVDFMAITPSRLSMYLQSEPFRKVMWRMSSIICGGEPFPPELLKKLKACTQARIYNQYGPSETTVAVSMKEISKTDKITIGVPMGNCKLYVLDQWMNPLPIGGNGKLFVGGKCVGKGYRNRPDLTEKAFRDNPFIFNDKIYDTGDMAYWTPNGEVVLTGRADRQVKLRGLRIELQEISSCLETYPGVTAAYAKLCDIGSQQILGAYYTADKEIRETDLLMHAARYLPEYMIPIFVLRVDAFKVTPNGKVDEKQLPLPDMRTPVSAGEVSGTAKILTNIFRTVLGNTEITPDSDYFLCGGNSLNLLNCILRIEEQLHVKMRVSDLYACRTAIRLAAYIEGTDIHTTAHSLKKASLLSEYALTPIQQGIYIQSVLDPNGLSYNMPGAFLLEREPDKEKLRNAFAALIQKDPIFRTVFVQKADGVRAVIRDDVSFVLEEIEAQTFEEATAQFLRPFDLANAPLLRGGIWHSPAGDWYMLIDSHHIVGDGMSTPILLQRLDRVYNGGSEEIEWNFYDYISCEAQSDAEKRSALSYWSEQLKDLGEPMILPGDRVRPKNFDFKGGEWEHSFSSADTEKIAEFCRKTGNSEYGVFLAAYAMLLSAVSGSRDLIIGTPVAGRDHAQSSKILGPFINTLPLRLRMGEDKTVSSWLETVREEIAGMLDHQHVGLEEIISMLDLPRGELNTLYRVMLTQSPVDEDAFSFGGAPMRFKAISTGTVKMDMVVELAKKKQGYVLRFSYARSVFDAPTIAFYGRCIEQILKEFMRDENRKLNTLTLLSPADHEKYIEEPNYRTTPFVNRPIHLILKSKALTAPDETAVIYHGEEITYRTLERRACAIARFLEEKEIKPGSCVGLYLRRTPDMIAAMYGVLKAGCAYMFMLDSFPETRLRYMATVSETAIILCDSTAQALVQNPFDCPVVCLPAGEAEFYAERYVGDDNLVNILFTSGSTGQPKGVMLRHRSVSNLYAQMKTLLTPIEGKALCSTNAIFDCFIVETLIALALGRTVVLADEEEMMLPWKLAKLIENYQTGIFEMTPSRLWMCLENDDFCRAAKHIRIVLLGGEAVSRTLADKFYSCSDGMLMNMYGPTEATVFTTMGLIEPGEHITIGSPLQNTRTYVLDENLSPVIPTGCGELYIAGDCLSAGYVSRKELTDASFVDDIYFPEQKMYKSGDLVRLRMDGRYDYIGRKDKQIKLNGQRVELSEITGALEQVPGIRQAAIVAVQKANGAQELCAFCVCGKETADEEKIKNQVGQVLPTYMVPSRVICIEEMPMTATNKVDMVTLTNWAADPDSISVLPEVQPAVPETVQEIAAEPVQEAVTEPTVEIVAETVENTLPVSGNEAYILNVWSKVLDRKITDEETSFFKLGGTSMAALTVLSHYYNDKLEMSLSAFYENPTAKMQASLLFGTAAEEKNEPIAAENVTNQEGFPSVLLTGATGFFGIHMMYELLHSGVEKVYCLVRDGSTERMKQLLTYYFGAEKAESLLSRIVIVPGDLTKDRLGLADSEYNRLRMTVKEIYHCAADVRHYAADDTMHMQVNVDGTERIICLAKEADAILYHMSTCSVSGDVMKDGSKSVSFTERDLDIGQVWAQNTYVKSKFLSEQKVMQAMEEGLRAKIFRLGRLVGRMSDGKFQVNPDTNAFYLFLQGIKQLGVISQTSSEIPLDVMPVDLGVKQVLALRNAPERVYHIMHDNPPVFRDILAAICGKVTVVTDAVFGQRLVTSMTELGRERMALVMNNWLIMETVRDGIIVSNAITQTDLAAAGFATPAVALETVLKEF